MACCQTANRQAAPASNRALIDAFVKSAEGKMLSTRGKLAAIRTTSRLPGSGGRESSQRVTRSAGLACGCLLSAGRARLKGCCPLLLAFATAERYYIQLSVCIIWLSCVSSASRSASRVLAARRP